MAKRMSRYQTPKYVIYYSIGGGQTSARYTGWTSLKKARKDARSMAKGNTPAGQKGFWKVYREDDTLGDPVAEGRV